MKRANWAAAVAGIVMAVGLTLAPARGEVVTKRLVWGSQQVVQGATRVVVGVSRAVAGLFSDGGTSGADTSANAQGQNGDASARYAGDFEWRGTVETGQTVEIKNVNGDIIAVRADGDEIQVRTEKRARRSDPDEVRIEVSEHADGVTLCVVYPSARSSGDTCESTFRGRNNFRNDVSVTFYVSIPENVAFLGSTVNGDVEVQDLASDVRAKSVNGDIEISTTGFAEASTVNGSINAAMGRYNIEAGLSFSTVNGSISLDLPDDVDADVDAKWLNGRFEADPPLALVGRVSRRSAKGVLGEGGPELKLSTVNGSIHIF